MWSKSYVGYPPQANSAAKTDCVGANAACTLTGAGRDVKWIAQFQVDCPVSPVAGLCQVWLAESPHGARAGPGAAQPGAGAAAIAGYERRNASKEVRIEHSLQFHFFDWDVAHGFVRGQALRRRPGGGRRPQGTFPPPAMAENPLDKFRIEFRGQSSDSMKERSSWCYTRCSSFFSLTHSTARRTERCYTLESTNIASS